MAMENASGKLHVLVIEDDPFQSALIEKKLELADFEVSCCNSIAEGLQLASQREFPVAVVDLDLGGESGLDFVQSLSRASPKTRAIIHSIDTSFETVKKGVNVGIFAYVEKGRNDNQLVDECHRAAAAYFRDRLDSANRKIAFQLRLLGAVDHGIIATDTSGGIIYWNRFSEKLTGIASSDALGRSILDFISVSVVDRKLLGKQMESGGSWQGEVTFQPNRNLKCSVLVRLVLSVLKDSDGKQFGSAIAIHDLTSIKANEERLERRAKLLEINAGLGRIATEIEDREQFLKHCLTKLNDGLSLKYGRLLMLDPTDQNVSCIASVGAFEAANTGEPKLTNVDELHLQAQIEGFRIPLLDNGKQIGCIEGFFEKSRLVSQEKRNFLQSISSLIAGVLLRNSAIQLWRSLFENSLDAVLLVGNDLQIVNVNQAATEIFGYARTELLGMNAQHLVQKTQESRMRLLGQTFLKMGRLRGELEFVGKDQQIKVCEFFAVANMLPEIHIAHVRDITQRRASEKLISEQNDQLAHVQRTATLGQMAATLAHEINQPLGAISNFAGGVLFGLEKNNVSPTELESSLRRILSEALRAGAILSRLRKFISVDLSKFEKTDLNECVRDTMLILNNMFFHADIVVHLELDTNIPPIQVDAISFQQVLVNIFKNSSEAMQTIKVGERRLVVRTLCEDGWVEVTIADNGPAVSKATFESLFTPYQTSKPNGLGMGLCISRSIVEQHNGTMTMSQIQPNGMRTILRLPIG
ncbi:MAG: PAS domain S-box protein [Planctomycetota bacterium]|nr:PAS domain S-box protein [Planctomycetota bacterium]